MKKYSLQFILLILLFTLAPQARATDFSFSSENNKLPLEEKFLVNILVDTKGQMVNAFEGEVVFPSDILQMRDVVESDSIIDFWIERPSLLDGNKISFSGIVPGGFVGEGSLFSVIFKTKTEGESFLSTNRVRALLNDGLGTEDSVNSNIFHFEVSKDVSQDEVIKVQITDVDPPEIFSPIITKIPEIAGDDYVLIFSTKDKDSGVDYYEVKEGFLSYKKAESPYVLRNQKLDRKIIIKAVDKAGNEREITMEPVYPSSWYEKYSFFGIIVLVIAAAYFLGRVSRKKSQPKQKVRTNKK